LGHADDAEEAFQATFMVLAAKAARVRIERSLAPWLYGVAYRTSLRAAAKRARRRETELPDDLAMIDEALENIAQCHWRRVLDDELNLLPEKYRSALVLHYLLGKTNKEVAAELRLSVRTVEGRQRRGKELLKRRLLLRNVSLPAVLALLAKPQAAAAPLVEGAIQASLSFVKGNSGACSAEAVRLAQSEVLAMSTPIAPISATIVTLLALGGAIAVASGDAPAQGNGAMPLAAAVEGAVAAADVEMTQTVFKATAPLAAGGIAASEGDGRSIYLFHRSPIERQILSTLETPLTDPLDFNATPLNQVMGAVSENYGLQIVFDTVALDAVAISPDTEVTTSLHDVPLRSALRLILKQIPGLTYIVKHDVLLITTQEEANSTLVTHIYDLSNLAKDVDADQLVEVIPEVVAFDSWQVNGSGEGTIRPLDKRMFVVNQTYEVHEAILALLEQMQAPKGPVGGE
jgi:RNA polymerase sigma factor (sigma-70 family)